MIIAVDAAGGDHYPESPVKGAIEATKENRGLNVILLGPEEEVKRELDKYEHDSQRVHVKDAPDIIEMDEAPAQAVKTKKNSSIVVGTGMLKEGACEGFVSAGNTGAPSCLGSWRALSDPPSPPPIPPLKAFAC